MATRKRRTRAAKARPHPTSGGLSLASSSSHQHGAQGSGMAPVVPAMTQGKAALARHRGDVTKGKRFDCPDSPLMRLPRDIRDKFYALLLTAPVVAEVQGKVEQCDQDTEPCRQSMRSSTNLARSEILPGSNQRYPFITESLGLLLANKQLHSEASAYLFSHNTFSIMPEWERIHCFWSCNNNVCRRDIPCLVHFRNFRQIKHLYILVNNPHRFEEMSQKYAAKRLRKNLETMAKRLKEAGVQLLTLKVHYVSCLQGQIDAVREELDAAPDSTHQQRKITMTCSHGGEGYSFSAGDDHSIIFQNTDILGALKKLPDMAERVKIIGDLPTSYITELAGILTKTSASDTDMDEMEIVEVNEANDVDEVNAINSTNEADETNETNEVKKAKKAATPTVVPTAPANLAEPDTITLQTAAAAEQDAEARAALLQKLSLSHPQDKEMHDFCEKTMRGPTYTPAFMERMLVPSQEEVDRFRQELRQKKRLKRAKRE